MLRVHLIALLMLAECVVGGCQVGGGHLRPVELRCESLVEPIGIDAGVPRFMWVVEADRRAEVQAAYQILVASSRERLARDVGDLWDSGRVESNRTASVEYRGRVLGSRQTCYWKVRSWDRDGAAGPWSRTAVWEMGLMEPGDWRAEWIDAAPRPLAITVERAIYGTPDGKAAVDVTARVAEMMARGETVVASNDAMGGDPAFGTPKVLQVDYTHGGERFRAEAAENSVAAVPPRSVPYLRRTFAVERPLARARLYATALGAYEVYLNGQRVGDQRMAPGWTDYRRRVQVQTFDVTEQLRPGENVVGAIVAPGWFSGRAGLFHARAFYGESPALLAQLEIEYQDGSTQTIVSDATWSRHDGPILAADIMDGEVHDARLEVAGWCAAAGGAPPSGGGWSPVTTRAERRSLYAQTDQPVRAIAELPARTVSEVAPRRWVFDLGQNMVGVARIRVSEPAGTRLTIRHAEMLNPDGTLYTANLRGAAATDTYVCRGGGEEIWEPRFTFHGFRYVELSGLTSSPDFEAVRGVVVATDLPTVGTFECSDDRINRLQSNIVWGLRGNTLSIPTDCPQRDERMGWTADTQVFVPTAAYNADISAFLTKWMRDVRDAQREDGAHSDVAPAMKGLSYGTPVWGDAGTVVPWEVYLFSGDTRILEENIDSMRRWVDWTIAHSNGYIRDRDRGNDYGDWLSVGAETPKDVIATAYAARSAWIVGETFAALGKPAEAARYREEFERFRSAFVQRYVREDGTIQGGTQTCYLVALRFGLVPDRLRDAALGHLVDDLEARGWRLSTGFVGVSHLLPVLDDEGRPDLAYRLLLQDAFPSWLYSVGLGATTIWERWDGWTPERGMNDPGMNSFNHFALGSCGEWLFGGVAGIRPDPSHPGFTHFFVRPRVDGTLSFARASYRSARGMIESDWRREGRDLNLRVRVPANTTATVSIPADESSEVLESGRPLSQAEGVHVTGLRGGLLTVEVGSGNYRFESRLPAGN